MRRTLWSLPILLVLAEGCKLPPNPPPLQLGVVAGKVYRPAHDERYRSGSIKVGEVSIPLYSTRHVPDKWYVTITSLTDDRSRLLLVSGSVYEAVLVGEYYAVGDSTSRPTCPVEIGGQ